MVPPERDEDDVAVAGERLGKGDVDTFKVPGSDAREDTGFSHGRQARADVGECPLLDVDMTLGSAIAIVVATAVTGAAMTAGGSDERAGSTTATSPAIATASTSPLATMGASVSSEATTSTSSTVPVATMPLQAVPTTVMTTKATTS